MISLDNCFSYFGFSDFQSIHFLFTFFLYILTIWFLILIFGISFFFFFETRLCNYKLIVANNAPIILLFPPSYCFPFASLHAGSEPCLPLPDSRLYIRLCFSFPSSHLATWMRPSLSLQSLAYCALLPGCQFRTLPSISFRGSHVGLTGRNPNLIPWYVRRPGEYRTQLIKENSSAPSIA